jgi:hypothetical protein
MIPVRIVKKLDAEKKIREARSDWHQSDEEVQQKVIERESVKKLKESKRDPEKKKLMNENHQ